MSLRPAAGIAFIELPDFSISNAGGLPLLTIFMEIIVADQSVNGLHI